MPTKLVLVALVILAAIAVGVGISSDRTGEGRDEAIASDLPSPSALVDKKYTDGNSRFSQGSCSSDANCIQTGCSGEVCSGGGELVTTCEFSSDFPSELGLECGCVSGICGWN